MYSVIGDTLAADYDNLDLYDTPEEALKEAALGLNRRSFTRIRSRRGISLTGPGQMLWPLPWARPMEPISFRLSWILTGL